MLSFTDKVFSRSKVEEFSLIWFIRLICIQNEYEKSRVFWTINYLFTYFFKKTTIRFGGDAQ
jgi:hypothetical protein